MSASDPIHVSETQDWSRGQVGMLSFLTSEAAFFSTLIVAYVVYIGKSVSGPLPGEVLRLPLAIAGTFCLLSSSATIHLAERALHRGEEAVFRLWWTTTIAFGALFLAATAWEWNDLIGTHGLRLGTNLFGTTYFTLVGFHAFHVTVGVITMLIVLGLALWAAPDTVQPESAQLVSWYWHFVDAVWIVVFSVVYVFGR
jgi:cytochrome c oxidase subunit 3/cytochrome o ubiquinol oxidase subunit 3